MMVVWYLLFSMHLVDVIHISLFAIAEVSVVTIITQHVHWLRNMSRISAAGWQRDVCCLSDTCQLPSPVVGLLAQDSCNSSCEYLTMLVAVSACMCSPAVRALFLSYASFF